MRISKPFCLSLQVRPYRWRGQTQIGLSASVLIDLSKGNPVLQSEPAMWQCVAEHLGSEGILDMGFPKPAAEFLVSGYAYTAHQQDKTRCRVRVQVNDRIKELNVFGDRTFLDNRISAPQPFERMSIGWENAYGGPAFENNPTGKGNVEEIINGVRARRMPNVESPHSPIHSLRDRIEPAGLGAQQIAWPARFGKVGNYSEQWKQTDAPGFFPDMDPGIFNAAMADQVFQNQTCLPDNTHFRVWNMHPDKPVWEGIVPAWQARCLVELQKDKDSAPQIHDVELVPTTLWLVPHQEQYLLVFHGVVPCWYDDGEDIRHVLGALEWKYSAKSHEHYHQYMVLREDRDESALLVYEDNDLLPENLETASFVPKPDLNGAMWEKQSRLQQYMTHYARTELTDLGLDANQYLPEFVGPRPQADLSNLRQRQQEREVESRQRREELNRIKAAAKRFKLSGGRDREMPALLGETNVMGQIDAIRTHEMPTQRPDTEPKALETLMQQIRDAQSSDANRQVIERQQRRGHILSAHYRGGVFVLNEVAARQLRHEVVQILETDRNFEGRDLSGADLRGLVFNNCNMTQVILTRADMTGTRFVNCNMDESSLYNGIYGDTRFEQCTFTLANLSRTGFYKTVFEACVFNRVILDESRFQYCDLSRSTFGECVLKEVTLGHVILRETVIDATVLLNCTLDEVGAHEATLHKSALYECDLNDTVFADCSLVRCAIALCKLERVSFTQSLMSTFTLATPEPVVDCDFSQTQISDSSMRDIHFLRPNFKLATIRNTDCSKSIFESANCSGLETPDGVFMRSQFSDTDFTAANLTGTIFRKSRFIKTNFSKVNFFRADLGETDIDTDSLHHDNYTREVQLEPTKRGQPA